MLPVQQSSFLFSHPPSMYSEPSNILNLTLSSFFMFLHASRCSLSLSFLLIPWCSQQGPAPHSVSACISRSLRLNMGLYQCTDRAVGMEVTQVHELIVAIMILFSKAPQVPGEEHERDSVFNTILCSSCKFTCPTPNKWVKNMLFFLSKCCLLYTYKLQQITKLRFRQKCYK